MADGTERTIRIGRSGDVGYEAGRIQVSEADALAKVDWRVWEKTLDSAFATQGLNSFRVNGGWRQQGALGPDDNRHFLGSYLDINQVNGIDINNASGNVNQDPIVKQFSYNLVNIGNASEVIQPWMTYNVSGLDTSVRNRMGEGFIANLRDPGIEYVHRNHLHVSFQW